MGVPRQLGRWLNRRAGLPGAVLSDDRNEHLGALLISALRHELRAPLHGVTASAEQLLEAPLAPVQQELCEAILESGGAMASVVDDLVMLTSEVEQAFAAPPGVADLVAVCDEAVRLVRPMAVASETALLRPIARQAGAGRVQVDRLCLRNLTVCILRKVVALAAEGRVSLVIAPAKHASASALSVTIEVTGPALAGPIRDAVAARLTGDTAPAGEHIDGRMAGFALIRALARSFGGSFCLAERRGDENDRLLRFALTLPLASAEREKDDASASMAPREHGLGSPITGEAEGDGALQSRPVADTTTGRAPTVLIVDDNPTNRLVASHLLRLEGCNVLEAVSGIEAIETVQQTAPRVILMDLSMPQMSGDETTRRIRQIEAEAGSEPAVIAALTANSLSEHRAICLAAGMDKFLTKPLRRSDIVALLESATAKDDPA
ncbi:MAG: response regulator [Pseudomonadota bacterium]